MVNTTGAGLGRGWQQLTVEARRIYDPVCHLCRKPIDLSLDPNDKWSWTLDHLDPRATHGATCPPIERTRPAHRSCNSRRQANDQAPPLRWNL